MEQAGPHPRWLVSLWTWEIWIQRQTHIEGSRREDKERIPSTRRGERPGAGRFLTALRRSTHTISILTSSPLHTSSLQKVRSGVRMSFGRKKKSHPEASQCHTVYHIRPLWCVAVRTALNWDEAKPVRKYFLRTAISNVLLSLCFLCCFCNTYKLVPLQRWTILLQAPN